MDRIVISVLAFFAGFQFSFALRSEQPPAAAIRMEPKPIPWLTDDGPIDLGSASPFQPVPKPDVWSLDADAFAALPANDVSEIMITLWKPPAGMQCSGCEFVQANQLASPIPGARLEVREGQPGWLRVWPSVVVEGSPTMLIGPNFTREHLLAMVENAQRLTAEKMRSENSTYGVGSVRIGKVKAAAQIEEWLQTVRQDGQRVTFSMGGLELTMPASTTIHTLPVNDGFSVEASTPVTARYAGWSTEIKRMALSSSRITLTPSGWLTPELYLDVE
jgi:hypothetical protein